MRRVFLGVDCGTQATKVVLRDPTSGEVVADGRAPHEIIERDDGTREQDPAWWVEALGIAIRDAVHDERLDIAGIGVSGQQHGLVCLDERDRPVRAAKLWNDTLCQRLFQIADNVFHRFDPYRQPHEVLPNPHPLAVLG